MFPGAIACWRYDKIGSLAEQRRYADRLDLIYQLSFFFRVERDKLNA